MRLPIRRRPDLWGMAPSALVLTMRFPGITITALPSASGCPGRFTCSMGKNCRLLTTPCQKSLWAFPDGWKRSRERAGILGRDSAPETESQWLAISEPALCTAVNGQVFTDPLGRFTQIRKALLSYYPEAVWRKKLAQSLAKAAQAGQYNYSRAMKRGERIAAELALTEFVQEAMQIVYLLNKKYAPFYKWMHRGLRELSVCGEVGDMLSLLYQIPDPAAAWEGAGPGDFLYQLNTGDGRVVIIEAVCNVLVQTLNDMGLSRGQDNFLQSHVGEILGNYVI